MTEFQPQLDRRVRVLLTEGSSLSARQSLYALGYARAIIDVCDPKPRFCLGRFSRYVRNCYRCPSFTADPAAYLQFLKDRVKTGDYDVLFPVHDQVYLLSRHRELLSSHLGLPVPGFGALERLQSKAEFVRLLAELHLPHPATVMIRTRRELENVCSFPCYIKLAYSTAGCGVWSVRSAEECMRIADHLETTGHLSGASEILVQRPARGTLSVVQCVFQQGCLVAGHCYQARALGVGGSARARVGVTHPLVMQQLASLGAYLNWHGALTIDYLWDPATKQPSYIDSNPRIGETFNASLSGVNLCAALVQTGLGKSVAPVKPGREGVRTHSVVMNLLALAQAGARRGALLAELSRAWTHGGLYAGSQDEITRPRDDLPSLLPALWITGRLLANPRQADRLINATVENYALTETAVRLIKRLPM
jgi:predicted ATP-grasp superfamily ATP-dependent carboligase